MTRKYTTCRGCGRDVVVDVEAQCVAHADPECVYFKAFLDAHLSALRARLARKKGSKS